jgi:subtilase family serine protease
LTKHLALRGATTAGLAAAVVASMTGVAMATPTAAHPTRVALAGSAPAWLAHGSRVGTIAGSRAESLEVYLAPKGGLAALEKAVTATSTPGSASYRNFLTTSQYYKAYAPTAATVASVTAFLKSAGLKIGAVDPHNRFLAVTGTAAQAEKAFGVTLETYKHAGQTVQAPTGAITLPTTVSAAVEAVDGLDTTTSIATPDAVGGASDSTGATAAKPLSATSTATAGPDEAPPPVFNNARPCSTYYGQLKATDEADYTTPLPKFEGKTLPYAVCGYTGPQLRAAYEGSTRLTGKGVTIGIVDAYDAPTIAKDANTYATDHGDGAYAPGQLIQTKLTPFRLGAECGPNGWYGEETLDVEASHALAPGADIHFYGAKSCSNNDLLAGDRQAVDDDTVQIVSNSFGDTESDATTAYIKASEQVFMQGAIEGISFMFSSGDDGDELAATGIKQADYQTSDPYVTSVGGTSTAIGQSGNLEFQTGWGTDKYSLAKNGKSFSDGFYDYGSGGGYSKLFDRPSYQDGVVPSSAPTGRAVPDVAMDADPTTGMLVGETQTNLDGSVSYGEYRIGGTSLASPLFAGMTALLDQHAGGGTGFLNPLIYGEYGKGYFADVAGAPADAGNVRVDYANGADATDGLVYSVRTFDDDSSLTVTTGYDDVTGVGVPTPKYFKSVSPSK